MITIEQIKQVLEHNDREIIVDIGNIMGTIISMTFNQHYAIVTVEYAFEVDADDMPSKELLTISNDYIVPLGKTRIRNR